MRLPPTPQRVYDNILGYLTNEFAFGPQEHKMRLEMIAVEVAKKCYKNTPCAASLQGANDKNNFLAMTGSIHNSQSITLKPNR